MSAPKLARRMRSARPLRTAAAVAAALLATAGLTACGKTHKPGEPVREGLSTPLAGLDYTVFLTPTEAVLALQKPVMPTSRTVMDQHATTDYAREVAEALVGAATYEFSRVYGGLPDSRDKRFIAALIPWVLERA